jgi:hypothetical protein
LHFWPGDWARAGNAAGCWSDFRFTASGADSDSPEVRCGKARNGVSCSFFLVLVSGTAKETGLCVIPARHRQQ